MLKSLGRIAVALAAALVLCWLLAWVALTQPGWARSELPELLSADVNRLRVHVDYLSTERAPRSFRDADNLAAIRYYLQLELALAGAKTREQLYVARGTEQANVIGRLGPEGPAKVIVGAHYDAFGVMPAADDNASGVAGVLELARILGAAALPDPVELVLYSTEEPPFFDGPEMGSAVHAAALGEEARALRGVIVLEMIGCFTERQPSPVPGLGLLYPTHGRFVLVAGRWEDRPLIRRVKEGFRSASPLEVTSYCGPTGIGTDLSDHRNYWDEGFEAVMITDTAFIRNPRYHTAADTADTLDYESMAKVVDGTAGAVLHLLGESE